MKRPGQRILEKNQEPWWSQTPSSHSNPFSKLFNTPPKAFELTRGDGGGAWEGAQLSCLDWFRCLVFHQSLFLKNQTEPRE